MNRLAVGARCAAGIMLLMLWGLFNSPLFAVALILCLCGLSIVRYRLSPYRWLGAAEAALCVLAACWWPPALLGLWLPVIGLLEDGYARAQRDIRASADADRAKWLRLEAQRAELLLENARAAAAAETAERARIAQDIHDHVGHEISGALIALQTVQRLLRAKEAQAAETLLDQSVERVRQAAERLRETVHNLKPDQTPDVQLLRALCDQFTFCPVHFSTGGDLTGVSAGRWQLLAAVLKECLTNVARHSNGTLVIVRLEATTRYIRLAAGDNGQRAGEDAPRLGLGLSGMRDRARLAGGSLTVENAGGFRVLCVLPL